MASPVKLSSQILTNLELVLSAEEIQQRVRVMGRKISNDFRGREIRLIVILKGAAIFAADLMRAINVPVSVDFVTVESYGASSSSSGRVRVQSQPRLDIAGRHCIIVDDILDTGLTLHHLIGSWQRLKPQELRIAVLLEKKTTHLRDIKADYVGFRIPNQFVVGYGMDYAGLYRNLPALYALPGIDAAQSRGRKKGIQE